MMRTGMTDPPWLAEKDESVVRLVESLRLELGDSLFQLVDHWDDQYAVGLADPDEPSRLVYVLTDVEPVGLYGVDTEFPERPGLPASVRKMGYADLVRTVVGHLAARKPAR